ncbi:ATP-dependent DNA helicase PIF1-like protein, partial [Leptotrombidium deliense]
MGHDGKTHSVRFRSISVMEMYHNMLGFPTCQSSLKVIYLPTDLDPEMKVLKNYHYMYGKDRTSEDVWVNSALDYYVHRPETDHQPPNFRHNMNDICYHDFFKFYNIDHNNYSKKEGLVHTLFPNTRVVPRTVPAVCRWHIIHMDEDIKKYCLQQLILYKPFRTYDDLFSADNINKDPIAECMTMGREKHPHFQFESISQMTFHYLEQMKQKQFDPKKILEYAQSLINRGYLTEEDLNLYIETLDFDISEIAATENNLFQQVWDFDNGETENNLPQPQTINYTNEQKQDFLKFTRERLTPDQRRVFNYFGKTIQEFDEQCLLFITGSAGCGKTYLIRKLMEACKVFGYKHDVVATTGVASMLTQGTTIHAYFHLNLRNESNIDKSSADAQRIRELQVLFIDEVSMMEKNLFHTVDNILRRMRSPDNVHYRKPFGGRHIVLVGDVAQLPVIQGKGIWDEPLFYEYFKIANLTTNKRQQDSRFLTVLNKIRLGNIDQQVEEYLNEHTIDGDLESNPHVFN